MVNHDNSGGRGRTVQKVLLVAVLVAAAGYLWFRNTTATEPLSSHITLVCVETGEIYSIARDRLVQMPARNPDTGRLTLLPCSRSEEGIRIREHYALALEQMGATNRCVDPQTLLVRSDD